MIRSLPVHCFFRLTLVLALCGASLPAAGQAQGPHKTLVLDVGSEDSKGPLVSSITEVIWAEAERNPAYVIDSARRQTLNSTLFAMACDEPTTECMSLLAEAFDVDRIIYARLVETSDLHDLTVNVFDLDSTRVVRRWSKEFVPYPGFREYFAREMRALLGGTPHTPTTNRLRVSSNVKNASVYINGQKRAIAPWVTEDIAPGTITIEVRADGFTEFSKKVELYRGEDRFYHAVLKPLTSVAATPATAPSVHQPPEFSRDNRLLTYGTVVIGVGVVTLGAGAVFGVLAKNTAADHSGTTLEREASQLRDRGEVQANTANVLYAAGSAVLIAGMTLLVVGLESDGEGDDGPQVVIGSNRASVQWETTW